MDRLRLYIGAVIVAGLVVTSIRLHHMYPTDKRLSAMLDELLSQPLTIRRIDEYECEISLPDNRSVRFWTANKLNAYASRGTIRQNGTEVFSWSDLMPNRRIVERLYQLEREAKQ